VAPATGPTILPAALTACSEPLSGSVAVDVHGAAGGPIVRSASIVFDGATSCDGCGEVFDDGVPVGIVCSILWAY